MAINLCYISFISDDNLLRHSPIRCTKTLMHLKSDFKPNILWENIVLIIHLKISWRWFITCCKKKISRGSYKWGGCGWKSIHKTRAIGSVPLVFFIHLWVFQPWLLLHVAVFWEKSPSVTFFIVTEVVEFCSEYLLLQCSVEISSSGRVSQATEMILLFWSQGYLCGYPHPPHTPMACAVIDRLRWF